MSNRKVETQKTNQKTPKYRFRATAFALVLIVTMGFISVLAYSGSAGWLFASANAEAVAGMPDALSETQESLDPSIDPDADAGRSANQIRSHQGALVIRILGPIRLRKFP